MGDTLKKLIDLPLDTVSGLLILAANEGMVTKPYMEKILIDHEKKMNPRKKRQNQH